MKNKIKKWHIALMSFMALFIAVFASLFSLRADTVDEETGEIFTDNWEISTVFYDSTIDSGVTPLTEINWDASDGSYKNGEPRVITVQINYQNTSAVTTYQPGELSITIDNPLKGAHVSSTGYSGQHLHQAITVGANDSTHTGYDWNYTYIRDPDNIYNQSFSSSKEIGTFIFTNANVIEEKSNFEGSIQIVYSITPWENDGTYNSDTKYKDEHTYNHTKKLQAILSYDKTNESNEIITQNITSNELIFNYTRIYLHPWLRNNYTIDKTANKITSLDRLPTGDYYWVKYTFKIKATSFSMGYPYINADNLTLKDQFPSNSIVCNDNFELLNPVEGTTYILNATHFNNAYYGYPINIYVGYPKSLYNETIGNLNITNHVDLYAKYNNQTEYVFAADDEVSLNLTDFVFSYSGELYSIKKDIEDDTSLNIYYESISGIDPLLNNSTNFCIFPNVLYTGQVMDIKIGDDLLFVTSNNGSYRKIEENEYCFTSISFPFYLVNGHNKMIPANTYNIELWIKYQNTSEYILYETFKNNASTSENDMKKWSFSETQNVAGFYFIIKDIQESIFSEYDYYNNIQREAIRCTIKFNNINNISESGTIHNFAYLQVYINDILQNEPSINSYANFITKEEIASFDQNTYGVYVQRDSQSINYAKYTPPKLSNRIEFYKNMSSFIQDAENEIFTGTTSLSLSFDSHNNNSLLEHEIKTYGFLFPEEQKFIGFELYDLLPIGMDLTSSVENIIDSFYVDGSYWVYDNNGKKYSNTDLLNLIKNNATINIIENYNNTNRTYISILVNFENTPLILRGLNRSFSVGTRYNYNVTYDSCLEYGKTWINRAYLKLYKRDISISSSDSIYFYTGSSYIIKDNGNIDIQESDINNNQNTNESIVYAKASKTITSVVSTHQDVTTYVKTDQNNYSTGIVDTSCNSEYEYKLRVRTGAADVTNLVIYTSIEEAQPKRTRWKGEFLGIDTTYAENKGYTVKVWYSPNKTAGTLTEDTSWQIYDEATVNKADVKSLAFQYLVETDDTTGTNADAIDPAVLPANSLTYVLIKMKSPADENIKTLARMDCWTQWNAIDEFDQPVDFITGINSNIVKVALPNSIKTDDIPCISLRFTKEIQGTETQFKNMKLDRATQEIFMIRLTSLTANDDGTYNQLTGLLSSTQGLVITQIPIGTYLLEELGDNYFDFVEFTNNNDPEIVIEGVTFEKTDQGYIITVSENLSETVELNIKVTNKTEDERFYEDKDNKENLFLKNKIEEDS